MGFSSTIAAAIERGEESAVQSMTRGPLVVARNNFVERPWGGVRIREHKRLHPLPDQAAVTGLGIGEAFELAAYPGDDEANRYPSRVVFADDSMLSLPALLASHGRRILGDAFVGRYGAQWPLLPKTLDVRELLSVQGHPPGNTEVYIIIDAEPGATISVGFNTDIDAEEMRARLHAGLDRQRALLGLLRPDADLVALHNRLTSWFPSAAAGDAAEMIGDLLAAHAEPGMADALLTALREDYLAVLESLNRIEVTPGQVIYNATPERLLGEGEAPSAEVHALGNPEGREVLALEVRLPGPTFRAWDNVRFPLREVDVDSAIAALNLRATSAADFIRAEVDDPVRPGVSCSVDCEFFRVEHLRPGKDSVCVLHGNAPSCLHVIEGEVEFRGPGGEPQVRLARGDAALVPAGLGGATLAAVRSAPSTSGGAPERAHVVSVTLPCD